MGAAAIILLTLGLFAAAIVAALRQHQTPNDARALQELGLSPSFVIVYGLVVDAILVLGHCAIATVLAWRKSDDWMALFVAVMLVTWAVSSSEAVGLLLTTHSPRHVLNWSMHFLVPTSVFIFFYLFPDGRFVPRWARTPFLVVTVVVGLATLFPEAPLGQNRWPVWLHSLVWMGSWAAGLSAQIYRYLRVSSPVQRQQTKWVVCGLAVAILETLGVASLALPFPALLEPGRAGVLAILAGRPIVSALWLLVPLSIGISILRHRLWDIDPIINRTLVYGTLTALLAVIYVGGVVLLRQIFAPFMGGNNQIAIVASTLAIAALFSPLRRRIQFVIDRRFYRRKYDAQKTLQAFSAHLRDETDLNQLSGEIVQVVQDTLQPAHVSLWLRDGGLRSAEQRSEASSSSV